MEKIKLEIDLIRDSLRNIFVVMFAIISGEITVFYRLIKGFNYLDFTMFLLGIFALVISLSVRRKKQFEIQKLLDKLEE